MIHYSNKRRLIFNTFILAKCLCSIYWTEIEKFVDFCQYTENWSQIKLLTRDFASAAAQRWSALPNHFRTSQSVRTKSTIHLWYILTTFMTTNNELRQNRRVKFWLFRGTTIAFFFVFYRTANIHTEPTTKIRLKHTSQSWWKTGWIVVCNLYPCKLCVIPT